MSYGAHLPPTEPDGALPGPTCARHRDTVTHIRCQRCEQPVCPACSHQAAVGVHCPDCFVPAKTRVFTGAQQPIVTYSLMGLCLVMFGIQYLIPGFTMNFALTPALLTESPWTLVTHAFMHSTSNPLHIVVNLSALYFLGTDLERHLGRLRFGMLYALSLVGAALAYVIIAGPLTTVGTSQYLSQAVGASGAIFGLFGAVLVFSLYSRANVTNLLVMLAINVAFGFYAPNIAWQAHLGGFIVGGLFAAAVVQGHRRGVSGRVMTIAAVVSLVALVAGTYAAGYVGAASVFG